MLLQLLQLKCPNESMKRQLLLYRWCDAWCADACRVAGWLRPLTSCPSGPRRDGLLPCSIPSHSVVSLVRPAPRRAQQHLSIDAWQSALDLSPASLTSSWAWSAACFFRGYGAIWTSEGLLIYSRGFHCLLSSLVEKHIDFSLLMLHIPLLTPF